MYAFFDNIVREVAGPGTRPGGCFQFRRTNARDCPPSHRGDAVRAGERLKLAHDVATWFALDDILDSDDSDYASEDEDLKDTLLFSVGEQLKRPLRRSQYPALVRTAGKALQTTRTKSVWTIPDGTNETLAFCSPSLTFQLEFGLLQQATCLTVKQPFWQ